MTLGLRAKIDKLPKWLSFIILEGWPILVLIFALIIEFRHIASSNWLGLFLYSGDSLTLPIIRQALAHKEPFLWISSSQFLLFPEGVFYAISSVLTKSIRASLVFNGALNLIILYTLFRWASELFIKTTRYLKQLFALSCCLLLISYMLLEHQASLMFINTIATLFLFTTYYYGVILSGAFLTCIMLQQTKYLGAKWLSKSNLMLSFVAFFVAALTCFSNPLFAIQFVTPMVIVICIVYLLNGFTIRSSLLLGLPMLCGSIIGYIARLPFKKLIGQSLSNHVSIQQIPGTLSVFHQAISSDLHTKSAALELLLVFSVIAFSCIYSLWWIYQKTHNKDRLLDGRLLLLSLFAVVEPIFIVLFSIVSGSMVTRYLLPLMIFPMFGLLAIMASGSLVRLRSIVQPASFVIISIVIIVGLLSISKANYLFSSTSYPDSACLANALDHRAAVGVGQYWNARPLSVYGQSNEEVLQVKSDLSIFPWLANLGAYAHKKFTFIIVNKTLGTNNYHVWGTLSSDPSLPSSPTHIYDCQDILVYVYAPGTNGYYLLNNDVDKSYNNVLKIRSLGDTSQLFQP